MVDCGRIAQLPKAKAARGTRDLRFDSNRINLFNIVCESGI